MIDLDDIPYPRINDSLVMTVFQDWTSDKKKLQRLNRCRCYLHILFLSDITLADGKTIDLSITLLSPAPKRSKYTFLPERSTRLDWVEWLYAWRSLFGRHLALPTPLGNRTHDSHVQWDWLYDPTTDTIIETSCSGGHRMFSRISDRRHTRTGGWYREVSDPLLPHRYNTFLYASCTKVRPSTDDPNQSR